MKTNVWGLALLMLQAILFASCDTLAQKDYYRASYATICRYSVNNYQEGDRLVFECSEGFLDTLEVRQVRKRFFLDERLTEEDWDSSSYAEAIVFLTSPIGSNRNIKVSLSLFLYYDDDYELQGLVDHYDYHNKENNTGCEFRKRAIPTDEIWSTDFSWQETFAEVKKDVGLYAFRNNVGTVWTFKKRLKK